MELLVFWFCSEAGQDDKPLLLIDTVYTNYVTMANRVGIKRISVKKRLQENGQFTLPDISWIEKIIKIKSCKHNLKFIYWSNKSCTPFRYLSSTWV